MKDNHFDHLTRRLAGRATRRSALAAVAATLSLKTSGLAATRERAYIATPETGTDTDKPVFMFVQTAASGRAEVNPAAGTPVVDGTPAPAGGASYLLTLDGHTGQTIFFSDRPERIVGVSPTQDFLDGMGFSPENPPNAALVAEFSSGQGVVVLQLSDSAYDPESRQLTYGAELLQGYAGDNLSVVTGEQVEGRLPAEFASAALFIDDCWDLVNCYVAAGFGDKKVGPIPGGPYGQCWSWTSPFMTCTPCHESEDYLSSLCDGAYPECNGYCFVGR